MSKIIENCKSMKSPLRKIKNEEDLFYIKNNLGKRKNFEKTLIFFQKRNIIVMKL